MPRFETAAVMRKLMARYYLKAKLARYTFRKVAWITSGGPVEPLIAMGVIPIYPENHGAMIGAKKMGRELAEVAEAEGYSADLCSYFRVDLGQAITHRSPVGGIPLLAEPGLPEPDFLLCCNNICGTVLKWYEVQARRFGVPLLFLDTPFNYDGAPEHLVDYVSTQFREMIPALEAVVGRRWRESRFLETARLASEAIGLWGRVLDTCLNRPAPMSCFDAFFFLAPIVTLRGTREVVTFYEALLQELEEKVARGEGAVREERFRLLWDNIPVWYRVRRLSETLARHGACLVGDTYTSAWASSEIDPTRPYESMARSYATVFLNRNLESKVENLCRMVERYQADGFIMHSNRSCKPYSLGQLDIKEEVTRRTGVPGLVIEADMTDPRSYSDEQIETRIEAFIETLTA